MKSTFGNMVLSLLVITAVSGAVVGAVYRLTAEPIARAQQLRNLGALGRVLPAEFDNLPTEEVAVIEVDGTNATVYIARMRGEVSGFAVESVSPRGFRGDFRIMVGFLPDGTIHDIEVVEQSDTPGFVDALLEKDNPVRLSFVGNNPANLKMTVRRDGGDIDAVTSSTVSSRAYVDAVRRAFDALVKGGFFGGGSDTDGVSGATNAPQDTVSGATDTDTSSGATATDASSGATDTAAEAADTVSGATNQN